jgi:lipopolysaccharide export system protein LptA
MSVSVERLRRWLLAGAVLLVVVIAGFLAYAHYRAHRFLTELPKKLGADIRQETNAFTWSQTVQGKTVFTLHAAKAIQHKDGKYTLRDVGIAVYGHGTERGDRVDRIYGNEFDLDQAAGVVRAKGEVHLDLEAPMAADAAAKMDYAAGKDLKAGEEYGVRGSHEVGRGDARLIHVKTYGLVYLQKLGVAATDEDIEFEYNGLTGHAKGAEYSADTGVLVLQSAVKVSGLQKGQPMLLTASRAELDRTDHKVVLSQAKYVTVAGEGSGSEERRTVEARRATVLMRNDGSAERLNGDGGVVLTNGDGSRMTAERGEMLLSEANKPQSIRMMGQVKYSVDEPTRQAQGEAKEVRASFDDNGHAEKVVLNGDVRLNERIGAASGAANATSTRELNASTVELGMVVDERSRSRPRDVKASGDARLKVIDAGKDGKGSRTSSMGADVLTAHFVAANGVQRLDVVRGSGQTRLEQVSETGVVETSQGDALEARFRRVPGASTRKGQAGGTGLAGRDEIASAVQQGHVVLTRKAAAKTGDGTAPEIDHATAARASYDGDTQRMTLSGNVEMRNTDGSIWSDRVVMEQKTGDVTVEGSVKASYRQAAQGETIHVLADRAEMKKASDTVVFYSGAGRLARLWQSGSAVEAPVLEFAQKQRRLVAKGDRGGAAMPVHTVLVSAGAPNAERAGAVSNGNVLRPPAVVRIASHEMTYSDESRTAEFSGGVKVDSSDGVMRGQQATAYLEGQEGKAIKKPVSNSNAVFLGGSVERVVVNGAIEIDQQGRRATGERLVYTAGDGVFVLTGAPGAPPRVMDQVRGTVTGAELRFRASDESVVVSNGETSGASQRVRTETRVKRDR